MNAVSNRKTLMPKIGIAENSLSTWKGRKTYPAADVIYRFCRETNTIIEELVDGEEGREYVISWAERNGGKWKPPERLETIIKHLERISDRDLRALEAMAKSYARDPEPDPSAERGVDFEDIAAGYGTWEQDDVRYIPEKPKPKKKKKDDEKAG